MLTLLLVLCALWPLLQLIRILAVTRMLLGLEMRKEQVIPATVEQIPAHIREAVQPLVQKLQALGFRLLGGWTVKQGRDPALDHECVVLVSPDGFVRALIRPHVEANRSGECFLVLRSTTAAGHEIVTASYGVDPAAPLPDAIEVENVDGANLADLWQRHRTRLSAAGGNLWACVDLEGAAEREQHIFDAIFAGMLASPLFVRAPDGALTYRPWAAVRRAQWLLREVARKKKALRTQPPPVVANLSAEARSTFDLHHYRQMLAITRGRMSLRFKTILSLVSLVLFAAVLAWRTSPVVAVTLLIALIVHEGGHLVGMWCFGYKDTQLVFLPFFGGAAVAHDDKILPPWQHIVILLLGPLPGIFAAIGLLIYHASGAAPVWVEPAAFTTLFLNAFNLLPILPLDGGQIVDCAAASRFPRLRVFFVAASGIGVIITGLALGSVSFLIVVGALMLFRLPVEWRLAQVRHTVGNEYPNGGDEETIVRRLLVYFRDEEWTKTPMAVRLQHARTLQSALRAPRPTFGTMTFAFFGYTAPLWLGLPAAVVISNRESDAALHAEEARAAAAGVAIAAPPVVSVPDEENGAVFYARAEALLDGPRAQRGAETNAEVIRLLRTAAHQKAFAPRTSDANDPKKVFVGKWIQGFAAEQLVEAANERVRYGEPAEAVDLIIDAFRLVRLMDTAPGWFLWDTHERLITSCFSSLEQTIVAGVKLSPAQIATLRSLADEQSDLRFATVAIPSGLLERAHRLEAMSHATHSLWLRFFLATQSLSPASSQMRARCVKEAIAAHEYLDAIDHGTWPEPRVAEDGIDGAMAMIARLGDVVARERMMQAALQLVEQRERPGAGHDQAHVATAEIVHPFTREPMRIVRHGAVNVMTLSPGMNRLLKGDFADQNLEWRLPGTTTF